jgi:predicted MPP superfamily phosphohydrolase
MIFTSFSFAISAKTSAEVDTHLQFNENGEFRILQIADIQDNFPMNTITTKLIKAAIETKKPDLIVLTGDNIGRTAGSKKNNCLSDNR